MTAYTARDAYVAGQLLPMAPGSWTIAPNPLPLSWANARGPMLLSPIPGESALPAPSPLALPKYQIFPTGTRPTT